jgi:RNA polymerase sigma-70 factor (ECF subfamily)
VSKLSGRGEGVAVGAGEIPLEAAEVLASPVLDRQLVALCRGGDHEAFAHLVALHEGMVFNLAARLLGDREEARDVAQDVFLRVYRRLGRFEGRSRLKTWIYRIVVNECHNRRRFWRRRRRDREEPLDERTGSRGTGLARGDVASPFEEAVRRERARRVQAALLELTFEHRAVLVLREIEGLSCEEVAGALGVAEGTVKSRLFRAREALRRRLVDLIEEGDRT